MLYSPRDDDELVNAWCQPQKDLVYATLSLLNLPEVLDMMELAVCMFVASDEWETEDAQQSEHSRIMGSIRTHISPLHANTVEEILSITSVPTGIWWYWPAPLVLKKINVATDEDQAIAEAQAPNTIKLNPRGPHSRLAPATRLFDTGTASSPAADPTARERICAVVSLARLLFHELLHLACVDTVPELVQSVGGSDEESFDPDCPAHLGPAENPEYTCDIVELASDAFNYFLDQLVKKNLSGRPWWAEVDGCEQMPVPQGRLGEDTENPGLYIYNEYYFLALEPLDDGCVAGSRAATLDPPPALDQGFDFPEPEPPPVVVIPDLEDGDGRLAVL